MSDEEAITRILDAADAIIEERGSTMKIADVARAVGVSRQTIYRYFPGTTTLLIATAVRSADGFLDRLAAHVSGVSGAVHAVVEGLAFAIETLPTEPKILAMLTENKGGTGLTSETSLLFSRSMLHRYDVDWEREGFDEEELGRLAEFCLRMLHSFLLDPGGPARDSNALRAILARWVGPVVIHPQMAAALDKLSAFTQPPRSKRSTKR
jgi:AcrR family transcriptional regulator